MKYAKQGLPIVIVLAAVLVVLAASRHNVAGGAQRRASSAARTKTGAKAQDGRVRKVPIETKGYRAVVPPTQPQPVFVVEPMPDAEGEARAAQVRLAERLSRIRVLPAHRVRHFAWLADGGYEIGGWHGTIIGTDAVEGGTLVMLSIRPVLAPKLATGDSMRETYLVGPDGTVQFVGAVDAPGLGRGAIFMH